MKSGLLKKYNGERDRGDLKRRVQSYVEVGKHGEKKKKIKEGVGRARKEGNKEKERWMKKSSREMEDETAERDGCKARR